MLNLEEIIQQMVKEISPEIKHEDTISQIEQIFRKNGFYTTKEYPIFKMKNESGRSGRIDLVARKGKFRVAVEYDHHSSIKWKSFQKLVQIKPETAIAITGRGDLTPNVERAERYRDKLMSPLYVVSLKEKSYDILKSERPGIYG